MMRKSGLIAAKFLFRWGMATEWIGVIFSMFTFIGVFTLVLGPSLTRFGISYSNTLLILLLSVGGVVLTIGTVLDRIRFWNERNMISTARNPFLVNRLYQKELLTIVNLNLPMMKALLALLHPNGMDIIQKGMLVEELDCAIARLEQTVHDKQWNVSSDEDVYAVSK